MENIAEIIKEDYKKREVPDYLKGLPKFVQDLFGYLRKKEGSAATGMAIKYDNVHVRNFFHYAYRALYGAQYGDNQLDYKALFIKKFTNGEKVLNEIESMPDQYRMILKNKAFLSIDTNKYGKGVLERITFQFPQIYSGIDENVELYKKAIEKDEDERNSGEKELIRQINGILKMAKKETEKTEIPSKLGGNKVLFKLSTKIKLSDGTEKDGYITQGELKDDDYNGAIVAFPTEASGWYLSTLIEGKSNGVQLWGGEKSWINVQDVAKEALELVKGTKVEEEHKQTFEDLYEHKIDVKEAIKETAEEHLKEDPKYYTKLEDMESDKYEGTDKGTGKLYEFFTPIQVVEKMWALAYHYGFKGGNILEPAIGSGRMLDFAPVGSTVTGFEINPENYKVAMDRLKKSEKFSNIWLYDQPFEISFLKPDRFNTLYKDKKPTWLDGYPFDLVIANPPYGKFTGLYKTYFKFSGQFEHFFIEYTMKLVKSGGLGIFIVPSSFMRNGNVYNEVKERIFKDNKLLDAYRLPSNIFEKTQIGTDIIVLQKK